MNQVLVPPMAPTIRQLGLTLCALLFSAFAFGQVFPIPGKPIRIIVPFPPGGQTDIQARAVANKLAVSLGVPVIVENKPGASTIIGAQELIKSTPDGHTLLYTISVTATQNPHLFTKLPYDAIKDLTPVMFAARSSVLLTVPANAPYSTVQELVTYAKANPGKVNFGSFSAGSSSHLNGELLKQATGIDIVHIPYKGTAEATMALLGGHVQMLFDGTTTAIANAKAGKVKILAYVDEKRLDVLPDVPTIAQSGLKGYEVINWYGVLVPAKTPKEIVGKLNGEVVRIMNLPAVKERLAAQGAETYTSTPEKFADMIRTETEKWAKVVKFSGAQLD